MKRLPPEEEKESKESLEKPENPSVAKIQGTGILLRNRMYVNSAVNLHNM